MKQSTHPNIHRENPPDWFRKSDFGIFIHWSVSSVPAYAPVDVEDYGELVKTKPPQYLFMHNPYADWYQNTMGIEGSPTWQHHREQYGGAPYTAFAPEFRERAKNVDADSWAELFMRAGAKYVVAVTKHHEGFVLYDTKHKNPKIGGYSLDFDHIGNLARACRARGMRFGVYYSSLLDWTFTKDPIQSAAGLFLGNDNSRLYMDYCYNHWIELIDRYKPDVLWSDIGYPADKRLERLFAYYYEQVPEGVVNDRWGQFPNWLRNPLGKALVNRAAEKYLKNNTGEPLETKYYDFRTIEYTADWKENGLWFEMCRGMDKSFGYNRMSRPQDYITAQQVRDIIGEIAPKKGRLLLNVGPDSYGVIPAHQVSVLEELGRGHG